MENYFKDTSSNKTISDWLKHATSELKKVKIISARLDSLLLLEFGLRKSRSWLLAHEDNALNEEDEIILNKYLIQRKNHAPLAYIIGSKEFYGHKFRVNKHVLIPRPESEAIIDLVIEAAQNISISTETPVSVTALDLGTGSGCLAISAKLELPELKVVASDISDSALNVAKINAQQLNAEVKFIKSDLLSDVQDQQIDIIIANLPYVPTNLVTSEEIVREPGIALFSGKTGLKHYKKFWSEIDKLKHQPTYIITESLYQQHVSIELFAKENGYLLLKTKDLIQVFKKS